MLPGVPSPVPTAEPKRDFSSVVSSQAAISPQVPSNSTIDRWPTPMRIPCLYSTSNKLARFFCLPPADSVYT